MNTKHYTYLNRMTKNRVLNYFQNKGAKVHFNHMKVVDPELSAQTGKEEKIVWLIHIYYMIFCFQDLRYGVI